MRTVPDEYASIHKHVREMSQQFDYVFTSGGVGPTHDDITYDAIARAFNVPLEYHQPTLARMQAYYDGIGKPLNEARQRMALFPKGSHVYYTSARDDAPVIDITGKSAASPRSSSSPVPSVQDQSSATTLQNNTLKGALVWTPVVVLGNVHILPGVPSLFAHLSSHYFANVLAGASVPLFRHKYGTVMHEGDLASHLSRVQQEFADTVMIGSYPRWPAVLDSPPASEESPVRVVISFDSDDEIQLKTCVERVKQEIPLVSVDD